MLYLVEKVGKTSAYILDTSDGVVEKCDALTIKKLIKAGVNIKGFAGSILSSVPCVNSDYRALTLDNLLSPCSFVLNEILTVNNGRTAETKYAGFAIVRGSSGLSSLKVYLQSQVVQTREDMYLIEKRLTNTTIVPVVFNTKGIDSFDFHLGSTLKFNYIFDTDKDAHKSFFARLRHPFIAPTGFNSLVTMFDELQLSDCKITYWDLRKKMLSKGVVDLS